MLYLCLGYVMSKLNNVSNVKVMGGIVVKMPAMFLFTLIAILSSSGVPFFSGFYSHEVIISTLYSSKQAILVPSMLMGVSASFLISYVLLKNIILMFLGKNKGNIHEFNKINENSFINKLMFFCLGLCLVFVGWLTKNLFEGVNAEYFWNSLIYNDIDLHIYSILNLSDKIKYFLTFFSLLGMFLAVVNYLIMPFILNNYKLKYYRIFVLYNKYFLRF
jgi:NADH-quinone oxidoreductase subunit L